MKVFEYYIQTCLKFLQKKKKPYLIFKKKIRRLYSLFGRPKFGILYIYKKNLPEILTKTFTLILAGRNSEEPTKFQECLKLLITAHRVTSKFTSCEKRKKVEKLYFNLPKKSLITQLVCKV